MYIDWESVYSSSSALKLTSETLGKTINPVINNYWTRLSKISGFVGGEQINYIIEISLSLPRKLWIGTKYLLIVNLPVFPDKYAANPFARKTSSGNNYIIALRYTDKSRYFATNEFNNCFSIRSPSLFSYFNHFLAAQGSDLPFFPRERGSNYAWVEYCLQQNTLRRY